MAELNSISLNKDVVVVGLGFVGLTLAIKLSQEINVIGIEKDTEKVNLLNSGIVPFHEKGINEFLNSSLLNSSFIVINKLSSFKRKYQNAIFIITIGTPIKNINSTSADIIENLLIEIFDYLNNEDVVIFRSTISVGTTDFAHNWFLTRGKKIHCSFCPERTIEGNAFNELSMLPQIISGTSEYAINVAQNLFSLFCKSILKATSTRIAELAKLSSNIERDVYFSFANELGFIAKELKLNYSELKSLITTDYARSFLKEVGPVAGPCLEKDTYILSESIQNNFDMNLIKTARVQNENWIFKISDLINLFLKEYKFKNVCISGLAFKGFPSTNDLRGSLALPLFYNLKKSHNNLYLFDFTISNDIIANHFKVEKKIILENFEDLKNKCQIIIVQNGSLEIIEECLNNEISVLDITTFHKLNNKYYFSLFNL